MLLGVVLVACGNEETIEQNGTSDSNEENTQIVNYVAAQEISGLDSVLISDTNTSSYVGHIQEGLYWEDESNEIEPALAEELPEISEDGLTYTIKMREDAQWENGDPITADDFVFAVQRLVDPDVGASFSYLAESIENANEIIAGEMGVEELGVTALDDYTVEIQLIQPTPYLLNILAFSPMYPQNRAYVEEQGEQYGTTSETVLSSGPYTIEGWVADYADGLNFLQVLQSESNYNYGRYSNEAYDVEYAAAETEFAGNPEERYQSMLDGQAILTEDTAFVPLYQSVSTQLRNPRVKGLTLRPVGNEFDFRTAYVEE